MEVFLGSIMTFGFNFNPSGWQLCNGQLLPIQQYAAVFSLLGTFYGGNGTTNFQLPNLQGRLPIGQGTGVGLSSRVIGMAAGTENVSIGISNLPSHTHTATFTPSGGGSGYMVSNATNGVTVPTATNNVLGGTAAGGPTSAAIWTTSSPAPTIPLGGGSGSSGGTVTNALTGNNIPTSIINPFLVVNFSIALTGLFPSRN